MTARALVRLRAHSLLVALSVTWAASLRAQTTPSPQELVARHDSLVGGRAALEAHRSVRMLGSFAIPTIGLEAPLEIVKVKPNRYLFRTSMGPMGEILSGYDGTTAWAVQPGQGAMVLTAEQAAPVVEQADFFGDLHDLARFTGLGAVDSATFEGKRTFRVTMVRANGDSVTEYFDRETGLSAGGSTTVDTPMGRVETTTAYSDYKAFGGVLVATRRVQRGAQVEIILSIVSVEFDSVDEAAVAPPDAVKALIRP